MFYVYMDSTDTGIPYYIGMGTKARLTKRQRNGRHTRVANQLGFNRTLIGTFETREQAAKAESFNIGKHGTFCEWDSNACNFTYGGEYSNGRTPWNKGLKATPEARANQGKSKLGFKPSAQHIANTKLAMQQYRYTTPQGIFFSLRDAAEAIGIGRTTLEYRFKQGIKGYSRELLDG